MWTLPNIITLVRICFTPVIALLPFIEGYWPKLICFLIFLVAAISDIYDGIPRPHAATRSPTWASCSIPSPTSCSCFATLIPIYWISRSGTTSTTSRSGAASRCGSACC